MIDVAAVRADTPGVDHVVHFNNAGASLMPRPVYDKITEVLKEEFLRGGYEAERAHVEEIQGVYTSLAKLVNGAADEIAVVDNATVGWQHAFYGMRFEPGDQVLTTTTEYGANFVAYLQIVERKGIAVDIVPDTDTGEIDVSALESMITDRTKLISINHMPTSGGLVNPVVEVGKVARSAGVPFLLDACQTLGQMPIDVEDIGCDMVSGTSRKFLRGPRGVGFLWVRGSMLDTLDPIMLDHYGAEWISPTSFKPVPGSQRFEQWESNVAAKIAFGVAVEYALELGLESIWERVQDLSGELRSRLEATPGVTLQDRGRVQGAIVTFDVAGVSTDKVRGVLHERGINVSFSTRAASVIDFDRRGITSVVRAAPHYFNTSDEIGTLVEAVGSLVT